MSDRLWRQSSDLDDGLDAPGRAPGKVPVTARLPARPQPVVFRVESAEAGARDANGVADGADVAVDRASGSSGSPLPGDLQSRFESSLGADLSSVRVHTGSESAEAAQAVGARAYTTGQDIHFGGGQYDPSSAFGVHLLAHEVAHTVQQQGSAPVRQNKLEVSTPQDGAELEADHAADLMVRGESASVLSATFGAARKTLHRDDKPMSEDEYVDKKVEAAEKDVKEAVNSTQVSVGATFSIDSRHKAELNEKLQQVEGWTKAMDEQGQMKVGSAMNASGAGSDITPDKLGDNIKAAIVLKEYASQLDTEGGDLSAIKNQHAVVQVDYTRALASINAAGALYGIDLKKSKGDGAKAAKAMADGMGVEEKDDSLAVKNKEAVALLTGKVNGYKKSIDNLKTLSINVKAQAAGMQGATARFRVHSMAKEIKDKTNELTAAKDQEAAIKGVVSSVSSAALAACGAESLVAFEVPTLTLEGAKKAGKDLGTKGAKALLDDVKDNLIDGPITKAITDLTGLAQKITNLNNALGKLGAEKEATEDAAAAADLEKQRFLLEASLTAFNTERRFADNLKAQLRDEWEKLGKAMDAQSGGGEKFALIGKTIGECDVFFGQAQKVYDTITTWEGTRTTTKGKKDGINASEKDSKGIEHGLKAWEFILADPSKRIYGIVSHNIMLQSGSGINVNEGQNPVQQAKVIKNDLRVLGRTLMDYRNTMVTNAMGINVPFPEVSFLTAEPAAE